MYSLNTQPGVKAHLHKQTQVSEAADTTLTALLHSGPDTGTAAWVSAVFSQKRECRCHQLVIFPIDL